MKCLSTFFASLCLFCAGTMASQAQNIGLFIGYESINEIEDDDEKAAAVWFQETYNDGTGYIITPKTLNKIDSVSTLWIPIDRVGLSSGYKNLPAAYTKAIDEITKHVKEGGSLYLTTHATQLVAGIGRVSDTYAPNLFGSGEGGTNADTWGINAQIGCNPDLANHYDHRNHAIYKNLVSDTTTYTDHSFFPLIGNGWKEDHNCKWDFNASAMGLEDNPNKLADFELKTNSSVIGAWQHVTDYACAGVIEFNPEGEYKGTVLCNGIAAYEFHQNATDGTTTAISSNAYQAQVELLTKNSLDYLTSISKKKNTATAAMTIMEDNKGDNIYYTISGIRVAGKPTTPGIYVVNHKKVIIK